MAEYFETSFGDKIPVDLAIEKKLYPLSADEAFVRDIAENSYASDRFHEQNTTTKVGIKKIASDLITFTLLIDYLDEMRLLNRTYDTVLDIAGAEGIHASLFRGHYAEHASVADVADGADPQLTQKLKRALWKYRAYKIQDRLLGKARRLKDKKHVNTPSFNSGVSEAALIGNWCRRRGSNSRPSVYKTAALPLCYAGSPVDKAGICDAFPAYARH
jgi:hypothetical protein